VLGIRRGLGLGVCVCALPNIYIYTALVWFARQATQTDSQAAPPAPPPPSPIRRDPLDPDPLNAGGDLWRWGVGSPFLRAAPRERAVF